MARLKDFGRFTGLRARQAARLARYLVRGRQPTDIATYRGYGCVKRVYIHGRVLVRPGYGPAAAEHAAWRNLLNVYRRARSNPVPYAEIRLTFNETSRLVRADDEGFFGEWLDLPPDMPAGSGWQDASVELVSPVTAAAAVTAVEQVMIPDRRARLGVISDIDDTVIQSHVTSFLRAARVVLLGNALTRLPFDGVAEFYTALRRGLDEGAENPLFYVSSSPWNLYDVIEDFLAVQGIPHGPLLLRDWDMSPSGIAAHRHHGHKEEAIHDIMDTYPWLPFVLIGDSGQKDPEIYARVVHDYPDRILAVYIRDVVRSVQREAAITALAEEVRAAGSTLLLVEDTRQAAVHAADSGWIVEEEVAAVEREAQADSGEAPGKKPAPA